MNLTIWKFPLKIVEAQTLEMPQGARLLSVQGQNDVPTLWAMVDPTSSTVSRTIHLVGTGSYGTDEATMPHVGTVQTHGGQLVWHVFDGGERSQT